MMKRQVLEIQIAGQPVGRLQIDQDFRLEVAVLDERFRNELERLRRTLHDAPIPYETASGRVYLSPKDGQYLVATSLRLSELRWQGQQVSSRLVDIQEI